MRLVHDRFTYLMGAFGTFYRRDITYNEFINTTYQITPRIALSKENETILSEPV